MTTWSQPIIFTNTARTACWLRGYPDAAFLDSRGTQIGAGVDHVADAEPPLVRLHSGQQTSATIEGADAWTTQGCDQPGQSAETASLRILLPNNTMPISVSWKGTACSSVRIHALKITAIGLDA